MISVPLYTIHPSPWRHQRQYPRNNIDEHVRCIILVSTRPPQLVQASTPDDEGRVDLQPIAPERGIFEEFLELFEVPLDADVWQVRHHVGDDLEPGVFCQMERFGNGANGVTAVGVAGDVLVDRLYPDLEPCTPVSKHLAALQTFSAPSRNTGMVEMMSPEMRAQAIVRSCLNRDSNDF